MGHKILITGSSSGFGKDTVKKLVNNGHQVSATMRGVKGKNAEAAAELTAAGAVVIEMDVTDENSVNTAVAQTIDELGGIDVVVNNAGVGVAGMQEHFTVDDFQKVFDVNVFGVQRVNRAVLPHMRAQGSGLIVYISSCLGRITLPFYGPYNASKWALEGMAENYRAELAGFGIENVIVEPGGFETNFVGNLLQPSDQSRVPEYGDFMNAPAQMGEGFFAALQANTEQRPEKVVDKIVELIEGERGKRPFRSVVDFMGMGDLVGPANAQLEQSMHGLYGNFQMEGMLSMNA